MRPIFSSRLRMLCLLRDERGIVLSIALIVMVVVAGIGISSQFSGYTNLLTSTNLKMAAKATLTAETGVNEALYRLSRQVGQPGAITPDLTDPFWNDPNWQIEINFTTGDTDPTDGAVSTIQAASDWPAQQPANPVIMRYKKPDPAGAPNNVLFYDRTITINPPFLTRTLPAPAAPAVGFIPDTAHPVIQILSTGLDERGAERHVSAEVAYSVFMPPPGALSSGVDVDMQGNGFIDSADHSARIQFSDAGGNADLYGNQGAETTGDAIFPNNDSPDDTDMNTMGVPGVYDVGARIFNRQVSPVDTEPAFVGVNVWDPVANPAALWTGGNPTAVSPIALGNASISLGLPGINGNPLGRGLFTWGNNSGNGTTSGNGTPIELNPPFPTPCTGTPPLVCRPASLTPFPTFQEFLGLGDVAFQKMLDTADTTLTDLNNGDPPLGFTYIDNPGSTFTFNNSSAMPPDGEFGLMYVRGNLRFNGAARFKGVIFIDGDLDTSGTNYFLGAIMVRGITETDAFGTFTLLYSLEAAQRGIQAGNPWRVIAWADTALQN